MTKIEMLSRCCARSHTREYLMKPFFVEIDGRAWAVGSDGHKALCMTGVVGVARPPEAKVQAATHVIVDLVKKAANATRPVDLAALRGFAGAPVYPIVCDLCGGDGCNDCHGTGFANFCDTKDRPARMYGRVVNLNLVAQVLADIPGATVAVNAIDGGESDPVVFAGDGWIAAVMPMVAALFVGELPTWSDAR